MRTAALGLSLFALSLTAHAQTSCPTQAPSSNWHYLQASCGSSAPCTAGQQALLSVGTYVPDCPAPGPCASVYMIQACDVVTWHFGDGTPDVSGPGASSGFAAHVYAQPGTYTSNVTIANSLGTANIIGGFIITANPAAVVHFTQFTYDVREDAGSVTLTLLRSGNTSVSSAIRWATPCFCTAPNTRNLPVASGTVTFAPGDTSKTITIPVLNDDLFGGDTFSAVQAEAHDGTIFPNNSSIGTAYIHVIEDDPKPTVTIDDVSLLEGDEGKRFANFTIHLSQPMLIDAIFNLSTHDGTAVALQDYDPVGPFFWAKPVSGVTMIPAGQSSTTFAVPILGDTVPEDDEWFTLTIDNAAALGGADVALPIARATARGTILNDDYYIPPSLRMFTGEQATMTFDAGYPFDADTTIPLSATVPAVISVPASLSIPAGKQSASFEVMALGPGTASVAAQLPPSHRSVIATARVEVLDRMAINTAPPALTLASGSSANVMLSIAPPRAAATTLTISASDATLLEAPSSIVIPAGGSASLAIHALRRGAGIIAIAEASSGATTSIPVDVVDLRVDDVQPRFDAPEGGALVTVSGAHLDAPCAVSFGTATAKVIDAAGSTLHVLAPAHAEGSVDLTITCGNDQVTLPHAFTFARGRRRAI